VVVVVTATQLEEERGLVGLASLTCRWGRRPHLSEKIFGVLRIGCSEGDKGGDVGDGAAHVRMASERDIEVARTGRPGRPQTPVPTIRIMSTTVGTQRPSSSFFHVLIALTSMGNPIGPSIWIASERAPT